MILRFELKWLLTVLFIALGPLGNMLTPPGFPSSFRAYYFLLPCFPIFYLTMKERIAKIGIIFLPFLIYCFVSASIVEKFGVANEPHTAFRFFLLLCQFLFVLGAASHLKEKKQIVRLLKIYLCFFFISVAAGYVLFFGYYLNLLSLSVLNRFTILTQFGFDFLRFSPGSYPNEYGIVASFVLSVLSLIFFEKRFQEYGFSKKWFYFLFSATFLAFILTTTRAAYLSFFVSTLYITWKSGKFLKAFGIISLFILAFFGLLTLVKINMFQILATGFTQRFDEGSLGERFFMWQETIEKAQGHDFWGAGFASLTDVHNVYLQLFLELGFVGTVFLIGSLFLTSIESFLRYKKAPSDVHDHFLSKIQIVGLINVLSFAASNHNLNHHLTWFVFFLCFAALHTPYLLLRRPERRPSCC